jgi:hypothetical protein
MTDETWQRIEREARAVAMAELERDENTPLAFGAFIAWTECQFGLTNGLSAVHRVGFPQHNDTYATCGERIPQPVRWVPLSPALVRTMGKCKFCEAEMVRIAREAA